jgi:hypothetical protein
MKYPQEQLIRITLTLSLIVLAARYIEAQPTNTDVSLCALTDKALKHASEVRELTPRSPVPCVVEDKAAVTQFLQDTIREDLPPQKLAMEELAYRAIGLIPDSFDYQHGLVEFLVGQIGGYYNPKKKLFVMAGWLPALVQQGVAVHELTHALQDQHYNLTSIINAKNATTDAGLAASALIEGDASAVMYDYQGRQESNRTLQSAESIESILLLQVLGLGLAGDVPESLKAILIFPYTSGLRFVHLLLKHGGYAHVHKAYTRVPTTTREILHPEDYLKGLFSPSIPLDTEVDAAPPGVQPEYADVLGEFGISSIFRGAAATKERGVAAAAGWVGDKLVVFPVRDQLRVISWLTRWETERDAIEFETLYREYLAAVSQRDGGAGSGELSPTKSVAINRHGSSVSVVVKIGELTARTRS